MTELRRSAVIPFVVSHILTIERVGLSDSLGGSRSEAVPTDRLFEGAEGRNGAVTVFWKAFAWTAIPIVVLGFVSTAGAAVGVSGSAFWLGFYLVWYGAAGVWLVATIAMVVLYTRGTRENASGIFKAFARTAIPIVVLSIVSTAGAEYGVSGAKFWLGFYLLWSVAAEVWLVATIAMVVLYARGKRESASGVLAGVGIGVLALGTTGLVDFATIQATFQ